MRSKKCLLRNRSLLLVICALLDPLKPPRLVGSLTEHPPMQASTYIDRCIPPSYAILLRHLFYIPLRQSTRI
jgi:hypothetical protein